MFGELTNLVESLFVRLSVVLYASHITIVCHTHLPQDNPIQGAVNKLVNYAATQKMKVNTKKAKTMVFNQAKSVDVLLVLKMGEKL